MNAKQAADSLLQHSWVEGVFPVDPVQIAKKIGIDVFDMELSENISGALIKEKGKDPIIVLSESDSNNRRRFSCAHELGHYAHRILNDGDHYEYVDLRSELSSKGSNDEEIFANQFAANLLMPESEVKKALKEVPAFLLAQHFGVSDDAINFRLRSLGLKR